MTGRLENFKQVTFRSCGVMGSTSNISSTKLLSSVYRAFYNAGRRSGHIMDNSLDPGVASPARDIALRSWANTLLS